MRESFNSWLKEYKSYKNIKAGNVMKSIDQISDLGLKEGIIDISLYCYDNYVKFAKQRQILVHRLDIARNNYKALELLGEFYQVYEFMPKNGNNGKRSTLYEYCESMRMTYSYKAVLIQSLLDLYAWERSCDIDTVLAHFSDFYGNRIKKGEFAENKKSVFSKELEDINLAKKVLVEMPVNALIKDEVIYYDNQTGKIGIASAFLPREDQIDSIKDICRKRVDKYYESLNNDVVDLAEAIENLEQVITHSGEKEKTKKTIDLIDKIKEIWDIGNKDKTYTCEPGKKISPDDSRKVGKLVNEQMQYLERIGYLFTEEDIEKLCNKEWSKKTFNVNYPFFKIIKPGMNIDIEKRDHLGNNRYWMRVFSFGDIQTLITSEWYAGDKKYFIAWFNDLFS